MSKSVKNHKIRLVESRLCFTRDKESGYFYESGNVCSSVKQGLKVSKELVGREKSCTLLSV